MMQEVALRCMLTGMGPTRQHHLNAGMVEEVEDIYIPAGCNSHSLNDIYFGFQLDCSILYCVSKNSLSCSKILVLILDVNDLDDLIV